MRFRIPGRDVHVRLFERVETTDSQYDVFDTGLEYSCGGVDSVVTGVAAHSFKKWADKQDQDSLKKAEKKAKKAEKKRAKAEAKATASTTKTTAPKTTRSTKATKTAVTA